MSEPLHLPDDFDPTVSGVRDNLSLTAAMEHHNARRFSEAETLYRKILEENPNHADALHLLGVLAHQAKHHAKAKDLILQAIALHPGQAAYHSNLGEVYRALELPEEALAAYRRALALNPDYPEALSNMANLLCGLQRLDEARQTSLKALAVQPNMPHAWNTLGNIYEKQRLYSQAEEAYKKALSEQPDMAVAWSNLGGVYEEQHRHAQAEEAYRKAISLDPTLSKSHSNLGIFLQRRGGTAQAIQAFEKALFHDPDNADAHWNLSLALLLTGNYQRGWQEYEWRWRIEEHSSVRNFTQPLWQGEDIHDKTILLHAEQGLGDAIQFARYIPLVAQRAAGVLVECQVELLDLFKDIPGIARIFAASAPLPPFDLQAPFLSLPLAFHTTPGTIPATIPYLSASPAKVARFQALLERDRIQMPDSGRAAPLRIGLAWAGSRLHRQDLSRSIPLAAFAPFLQIPGISFISLQKGYGSEQLASSGLSLRDLSSEIRDVSDTAALIANLDLVISVDTAVVHLAGALAKPVWILLAKVPDWRWFQEGAESLWYPSARLFRQTTAGDWSTVIAQIVGQLHFFAQEIKD